MELVNRKAKMEEQLKEISQSLSRMEVRTDLKINHLIIMCFQLEISLVTSSMINSCCEALYHIHKGHMLMMHEFRVLIF